MTSLRLISLLAVVFYLNAQVLIPRIFHKGKFRQYLLAVVGLLIAALLINMLVANALNDLFGLPNTMGMRRAPIAPGRPRYFLASIPFFFFSIAILFAGSIYQLGKAFHQKEQQAVALQKEKMEQELKFLRTQINPHFLFNALNNLHATVQLAPQRAGNYILKLGEMLRYVLEECQADRVSLTKEVRYLKNYIYFQQIKNPTFQNIELNVEGWEAADFQLEPLLFIPLIENAFMHSYLEDNRRRFVSILIQVRREFLRLSIQNNLPADVNTVDLPERSSTGIGIHNVRRRLALLYPNQHFFSAVALEDNFQTELIIYR